LWTELGNNRDGSSPVSTISIKEYTVNITITTYKLLSCPQLLMHGYHHPIKYGCMHRRSFGFQAHVTDPRHFAIWAIRSLDWSFVSSMKKRRVNWDTLIFPQPCLYKYKTVVARAACGRRVTCDLGLVRWASSPHLRFLVASWWRALVMRADSRHHEERSMRRGDWKWSEARGEYLFSISLSSTPVLLCLWIARFSFCVFAHVLHHIVMAIYSKPRVGQRRVCLEGMAHQQKTWGAESAITSRSKIRVTWRMVRDLVPSSWAERSRATLPARGRPRAIQLPPYAPVQYVARTYSDRSLPISLSIHASLTPNDFRLVRNRHF
jgi:hypothetical protein